MVVYAPWHRTVRPGHALCVCHAVSLGQITRMLVATPVTKRTTRAYVIQTYTRRFSFLLSLGMPINTTNSAAEPIISTNMLRPIETVDDER